MVTRRKKRKTIPVLKKVVVTLDDVLYTSLQNMANMECRTVSQQIKYLMLVGKEMVDSASSQGQFVTRGGNKEDESKELESAIGFKVE